MRVLVLESNLGCSQSAVAELDAAGHEIVRCHEPGAPAFPCAALVANEHCPLTEGAVDVALAVRHESAPTAELTGGEIGASCALRHFVPVVTVGHSEDSPLFPLATDASGSDGTDAAIRRAQQAPLQAHGRLASDAFRHVLDVHALADVHGDARVTRQGNTVRVELTASESVPKSVTDVAAVRAVAAIRTIDQLSPVINVVVDP